MTPNIHLQVIAFFSILSVLKPFAIATNIYLIAFILEPSLLYSRTWFSAATVATPGVIRIKSQREMLFKFHLGWVGMLTSSVWGV